MAAAVVVVLVRQVVVVEVVQLVDMDSSSLAACSILPRLVCNLVGLPDLWPKIVNLEACIIFFFT